MINIKYFFIIARTALGGLSNNLSKLIILAVPMYYFLLFRYIGMIILNFSVHRKKINDDIKIILKDKKLQKSLFISAIFSALGNIFFYQALKNLPVSLISLLDNSFHLIFVVLIAVLFLKEKKTLKFYFYFSLLFPALFLLTFPDLKLNLQISLFGLIMVILNGFVSALDVHMTRSQLKKVTVGTNVLYKSIVSLTVTIVCIFIFNENFSDFSDNLTFLLSVFLLYNIVNSFIIKILHSKSLIILGTTVTTIFSLLTPIFGIFFAFLIFKETINFTQSIGILIIIFSLYKLK